MSHPNFNEKPVDVALLDFDKENPRYAPTHTASTDIEIVRHLSISADLKELLQSISANGYIDIEPLIVMKNPENTDRFIVLEGNRRLAALKLLRDPAFADKCQISGVPTLDESKAETIKNVYTTEVETREQARALIGFKHINGPQRWDSFAKAHFAKEWYVKEKEIGGSKLKDIANSLGDGHSVIKRLVFGILALEQAEQVGLFSIADRYLNGKTFAFSHFYTALSKPGYQKYLGIEDVWKEQEPPIAPIKKEFFGNLKQVLLWLYGSNSEEIQPVIKSQNPNLRQLNEILSVPKALKTLEAKGDLLEAYYEVQPPLKLFEISLIDANKSSEDALKRMSSYEVKDATIEDIANTLFKNSKIILNHVRNGQE